MKPALALVCVLAGCAAQTGPEVQGEIGFRNPTAPLGGTARFDPARFAGDWKAAACMGPCAPRETYSAATDGVYLRETSQGTIDYVIDAPGVLRAQGTGERLVVMWVDEGFRTAAIGDADGRWAAIIDRTAPSPDRMKAAREMLDFNGFDVSRLGAPE